MHDPPEQRIVFATGLRAQQRIGVAGERFVDDLPVFREQVPPRERQDLFLFAAHMVPVERRVGLDCRGKRGEPVRTAMLVSRECVLEVADLRRARLVLGVQLIEQRARFGMTKPQSLEQVLVLLRVMEALGVLQGNTKTFTISPSPGYAFSVGGTCGGTLSGNQYTIAPISLKSGAIFLPSIARTR